MFDSLGATLPEYFACCSINLVFVKMVKKERVKKKKNENLP